MINLDKNGFPVLVADRVDLGVNIVPTKTGQGNPAHDTFSGRFSFLPGGVQVLQGEELLRSLSTATRKVFFQRAAVTKANQVSAQVVNGKLHIVLLNNGRRLDSFVIAPQTQQDTNQAPSQTAGAATGATQTALPLVRDAIVEAAREGLQGSELRDFLLKRKINVTGDNLAAIMREIELQKKNDIVDYLNQQLRQQVNKENQIDRIRLSVGRGFLRKVFAHYKEDEVRGILQRLEGMGWSQDVIHSNVISKLPKRLRDPLQSSFRKQAGKKEIQQIKEQNANPANSGTNN